MSEESTAHRLGRRGLLVGAGTAMAGGLVAAGAGPASAAPKRPAGDGTRSAPAGAKSSPIPTSIASNPASGVVYRYVHMYDFKPFDPTANAIWGGAGLYTSASSSPLRASIDIPPGSTIRDIEYYVYNSSGSDVVGSAYVWAPGSGVIWSIDADATIASNNSGNPIAVRIVPGAAGPYPFGTRLLFSVSTPTNGTVQVNGARAGFSGAGAAIDMLDAPVRAYDSRATGGRFAVNETRTVTLAAGLIPKGVTGVVANITATGSTTAGYLKVFAGGAALPPTSTVNFAAGQTIANAVIVGVSASRQLQIEASAAVHAIVDVIGVIG